MTHNLIFIAGALSESSGKTTLALALIEGLKELGLKIAPFKPLSGHSMWWQYDAYLLCLKNNSLFCEDAYKLSKVSNVNLPLEIINPADILTSIPDFTAIMKGLSVSIEGSTYDWFAIGRFTIVEKGDFKHIIYYKNPRTSLIEFPEELLNKLKSKAYLITQIRSFDEFLKFHQKYYLKAVNSCYDLVFESSDIIVIEGFNDSIYPWHGIENSDIVLIAAPANIMVYPPREFIEAVKALGDPFTKVYKDVYKIIRPLKIYKIPPLTKRGLSNPDVLKRTYKDVIEDVIKKL